MPPTRNDTLNTANNISPTPDLFKASVGIGVEEEIRDYLFDPVRILGVCLFVISIIMTIIALAINYTLDYQIKQKTEQLNNGDVPKFIKDSNLVEANSFYNNFILLSNKLNNKNYLFGVFNVLSEAVEDNSYFSSFNWSVDNNNQAQLNLNVISNTLESAILQKDKFELAVNNNNSSTTVNYAKAGIIKSVKIGDVSKSGNIGYTFTINMKVDNKKDYIGLTGDFTSQRLNGQPQIIPIPAPQNTTPPANTQSAPAANPASNKSQNTTQTTPTDTTKATTSPAINKSKLLDLFNKQ